ncbi:MAG: hypothetical protein IKG01_12930 [Lachnospiraceae bacterium]|nr:hypothetical protein [Lachnospiraceae bacterium]
MTDIRDINSTSHSSKNLLGNTVHTVRDSLVAESLLSVIMGITILSLMLLVKSYVEMIDVGMYPAFVTLIVPVLHTVVRRTRINSQFLLFLLHVAVSASFFFIAINIPFLQFGSSLPNRLYLAAILTGLTLFSLFYRIRPTFTAGDTELIIFPALIHVIFYLLYAIAGKGDYAHVLIIHAIIIAILFIIMRQLAVFDSKFYHSIHKISRPNALLKRQNYKTIAGLIVVIAVSLGVLAIFPVEAVSDLLKAGIVALFDLIASLITLKEPDYEIDLSDPLSEVGDLGEEGQINPWIDMIGTVLAVILIIVVIYLVLRGLLILIQNAPKITKGKNNEENSNLIDTIEDIRPDKRSAISRSLDFGTGYERRIRKQFYNRTRRAMKKGLPVTPASTPGQIETVLQANGDNDFAALRQEYEKVRYGK